MLNPLRFLKEILRMFPLFLILHYLLYYPKVPSGKIIDALSNDKGG